MLEVPIGDYITGKLYLDVRLQNSVNVNNVCWRRSDGSDGAGGGSDGLEGMGLYMLIASVDLAGCYVSKHVGILNDLWVLDLPPWPPADPAALPEARWTWVGGQQTRNELGQYSSPHARPGSRRDHSMWSVEFRPAVGALSSTANTSDVLESNSGSGSGSGSSSGSWYHQYNSSATMPGGAVAAATVREELNMVVFGGVGFGGPAASGAFSMIGYLVRTSVC